MAEELQTRRAELMLTIKSTYPKFQVRSVPPHAHLCLSGVGDAFSDGPFGLSRGSQRRSRKSRHCSRCGGLALSERARSAPSPAPVARSLELGTPFLPGGALDALQRPPHQSDGRDQRLVSAGSCWRRSARWRAAAADFAVCRDFVRHAHATVRLGCARVLSVRSEAVRALRSCVQRLHPQGPALTGTTRIFSLVSLPISALALSALPALLVLGATCLTPPF